MYLMALANTVANTQTDFSDKFTDTKQSAAGIYVYGCGCHGHIQYEVESETVNANAKDLTFKWSQIWKPRLKAWLVID